MKRLDTRFYTLDELAEEIGRERDKHFAGNAKNDLTKWGYEYEWRNGRGVEITKRPETAKERMAELMYRQFRLDIQIDVEAFSLFLYLMLERDGVFSSMPWVERVRVIREDYGVKLDERRMSGWLKRLREYNIVYESEVKTECNRWKVWRDGDDCLQRRLVADDDEEYATYKKRQSEVIAIHQNKDGSISKQAWKMIYTTLWHEFHYKYYTCSRIEFNGIVESIDEIVEWAMEICMKDCEGE